MPYTAQNLVCAAAMKGRYSFSHRAFAVATEVKRRPPLAPFGCFFEGNVFPF
jgi:hypothetical protein